MNNSDFARAQLKSVNTRILRACELANRQPEEIRLIGAAKQQPSSLVEAFIDAGLEHIGENYLSDAQTKMSQILHKPKAWHFIGAIQSNKTKLIANQFDWVHSIDRIKIARRLNDARENKPLNVLIQINLNDESNKAGVTQAQAGELALQINHLPKLKLKGLMVIPKPESEQTKQRDNFRQSYELMQKINSLYSLEMNQLSMGMSTDLEAAISEGSTMIRIGTDLFGARTFKT